MLHTFQSAENTRPANSDVYWCIVKSTELTTGEVSYHYSFCEFTSHWLRPILPGQEFEIVAWCELENPSVYFRKEARLPMA